MLSCCNLYYEENLWIDVDSTLAHVQVYDHVIVIPNALSGQSNQYEGGCKIPRNVLSANDRQ